MGEHCDWRSPCIIQIIPFQAQRCGPACGPLEKLQHGVDCWCRAPQGWTGVTMSDLCFNVATKAKYFILKNCTILITPKVHEIKCNCIWFFQHPSVPHSSLIQLKRDPPPEARWLNVQFLRQTPLLIITAAPQQAPSCPLHPPVLHQSCPKRAFSLVRLIRGISQRQRA